MNKKVNGLMLASITAVLALAGCGRNTTPKSSEKGDDTTSQHTSEESGETYSANATKAAEFVTNTWKGSDYLEIKQHQWEKLQTYYKGFTKTATTGTAPTVVQGTELRVAGGYQKTNEAISFQDATITKEGIKLADGVTYHTSDLKPTWAALQNQLGIKFKDVFKGSGSAEKEYKAWENNLEEVDIIAGSASLLVAAGSQGKVVDLNKYMDKLPNFKNYLDNNQIARLSITGSTEGDNKGAIYFSPYFDGVDDIERMPLIRADMVRKLLDGDTTYTGANRTVKTNGYNAYMPTSGSVEVDVSDSAGSVKKLTKDYSKYGNIIAKMNAESELTGDKAVQMFREYIDKTYAGHYANRSDLFLGYDAAWDADEMVALLRCAGASLNDSDGNPITPLYSRETGNNQRDVDLTRFAGSLFGARGLESRQDYLYFDTESKLHDARQEAKTYDAMERMHGLVTEGLVGLAAGSTSASCLEKDAGIMSYDYNQTQTVMNATKLQEGEEYIAIMVPVAKWSDGKKTEYKRFTESWRSVKTDGWAISAAGVEGNQAKLDAALALIDFAFSVQGQITMSYGPDSFIKVKDSSVTVKDWSDVAKKYETFNFNGTQMPVIKDETYKELQDLASGNYTNYARRYLGSTLNGFPKSQAFEYQCTNDIGKKGSAVIATAIGAGTLDHPVLAINEENMWYTSIPTTLPTTSPQTDALKALTDITANFSSSKGGTNVFYNLIATGATGVDTFNY